MRTSTIGVVKPTGNQTYTASDILQTTPPSLTNPTYLASPGVQIGPGVDLITKSAGSKPFSTNTYPTTLYYGLKGLLSAGTDGYMWPGTQAIQKVGGNGVFPDPSLPAAFYKVQQPAILSGMSIALSVGPGTGNNTVFQVYRTPVGGSITAVTLFTLTFTGTDISKNYYNSSQDFAAGDLLHIGITYTGGNGNTTTDISLQLDMF
jgi:hypothetical protein